MRINGLSKSDNGKDSKKLLEHKLIEQPTRFAAD